MKRQWINHKLSNLPNEINQDRLYELVIKLRNSTITIAEKEEIINGHLKLVISLVGGITRYQYKDCNNIEDVVGEASLALIEAVNDAEHNLYNNEITPYIISSVIYKCKEYLTKLSAMRMPARTIRHKIQHGTNKTKEVIYDPEISQQNSELLKKIPVMYQQSLIEAAKEMAETSFNQLVKETLYETMNIPKRTKEVVADILSFNTYYGDGFNYGTNSGLCIPEARQEEPSLELTEAIRKSAESPMQQAIIELRMQGHSYKEIGEIVGYSLVRVGEIVRDIEKRFEYYWDN